LVKGWAGTEARRGEKELSRYTLRPCNGEGRVNSKNSRAVATDATEERARSERSESMLVAWKADEGRVLGREC
jgi:hypothetical protein